MIKSIKLRFGKTPASKIENIDSSPITVFVGPNHSGKSRILNEIYQYCISGNRNSNTIILDEIIFENSTEEIAAQKLSAITQTPLKGEMLPPNQIFIGRRGSRNNVSPQYMLDAIQNPNTHTDAFCYHYLRLFTLMIDGPNRINLVTQQSVSDLQRTPEASFQVLFQDKEKREKVRKIIHEAFGSYFTIDPTHLGILRIRLAQRPPENEMEELGIHTEAIKYHSESMHINEGSDGVKAFTGIITELVAGDPSVLLIDEPEAFLHPALATKLGSEIAKQSANANKRVFVSTHSPNFVMGCIQSGAKVNIVRLTYRNNVATARLLENSEILKLMRNPLLRSVGVLSGLFYEFVVVTEGDADRAFYQEINERLLRFNPSWGIPNCLFLNAQNKQTVHKIIAPLRDLGIPAAAIVDVDILKDGGTVWMDFLKGGNIPTLDHSALATSRSAIKQKFDEHPKEMKRDGGINILAPEDREVANNLFDSLDDYGLFAVRHGEVESWLPLLNCTGHGPEWLIQTFEKMGEDADDPNYLKPSENDVWRFLYSIKKWLINPNRKGIPS